MKEPKLDYQADSVCYIRSIKEIKQKEIPLEFGNVTLKQLKTQDFIARKKSSAKIIPVDKLWMYEAALFQIHGVDMITPYRLSDILVDFEVDKKTGKVTAKKLYKHNGKYEMETRIYYTGNYNQTWRAWTALPEDENAYWE